MPNLLKNLLLTLSSAILLSFSLPPYPLGWISFFAYVPFFYVLDKSNQKWFWYSFLFGLIFFGLSSRWIALNSGTTKELALLSYIVLAILLALRGSVIFLSAVLLSKLIKGKYPFIILLLVYPMWEWIYSLGEVGFPWFIHSLFLLPMETYNGFLSITGIWGASTLILTTNYLLYNFILTKNLRLLFAFVALLILPLFLPVVENPASTVPIRVGVVQQNIDPVGKWADDPVVTVDRAYSLSKSVLYQNPDFYVWPETAIPFHLLARQHYRERVQRYIDSLNVPVISGAQHFVRDENGIRLFNAVFCIRPTHLGGVDTLFYAKRKLVPAGERMPFQSFLPFMGKLRLGQAEFSEGPSELPLPVPTKKGTVLVGTPVCYESIFPSIATMFAKHQVQILANVTNDGWYEGSNEKKQHAELFKARAFEIGVPLVRSANTGISGWINAKGEWVEVLEESRPIAKVFEISIPKKPFRAIGSYPWLPILSTLLMLSLLVYSINKKK